MIVGIDPGVDGAMAGLRPDGTLAWVMDLPAVEVLVGKSKRRRLNPAAIARALEYSTTTHVVIEKVSGRPTDGPVWAFNFGEAFGIVQGIASALRLPSTLVQPHAWRSALGVTCPAGSLRVHRKEASRQRAIALFPDRAAEFSHKKDADRAEAALIGLWGVRCNSIIRSAA